MDSTFWETLILIKICASLLQICYDERSDFRIEVQDTPAYQHGFCMKKGHAFDASIKCSDELKISDEEQNEEFNHCETLDTLR